MGKRREPVDMPLMRIAIHPIGKVSVMKQAFQLFWRRSLQPYLKGLDISKHVDY